jgi:cytidylate kinase
LGLEALSTGGIQRKLAAARGITTLELNLLAEKDPSIDRQIDDYLRNLPRSGDLVVESRMAWHFVPGTKKAFLYILVPEAASRILNARRGDENYKNLDDSMALIAERRRSEIKRFQKYYGVNIDDLRNYDVVVDTTFSAPPNIVETVLRPSPVQFHPLVWLNPKNLVPTQGIRDLNPTIVEEIMRSIEHSGFDNDQPIRAIYVDHAFFIVDGHNRAAAAIKRGLEYVPLILAACEDETYISGLTARHYVETSVSDSRVYDWEDAVGFRYKYPIWKPPLPPRQSL